MKSTPPGWPRISSSLAYDDPPAAIDWLCRVFGFEVRLRVDGDDGSVHHAELTYGDGLVMVGDVKRHGHRVSPRSIDGKGTQSLMVFVDDCDAFHERATRGGAKSLMAPETHDYGDDYWADRSCQLEDLEGHRWWFVQRVKGPGATAG